MHEAPRKPVPNRSRTVREMDASSKLFAAISILQSHILADDTVINVEAVFGVNRMTQPSLELAESLLQDLVPIVMNTDKLMNVEERVPQSD